MYRLFPLFAGLAAATAVLAAPADPAKFRSDARAIETLVAENYAYPERLPGGRLPLSGKLRAEAEAVANNTSLLRFAERALATLADHHAITGSSFANSSALVPSQSDLWVEPEGRGFAITAVRAGSPAAAAGIRPGDRMASVEGVPAAEAVRAFWADLGLEPEGARAGYAARVLAAGRRDRPRHLGIEGRGGTRDVVLPHWTSLPQRDVGPVSASEEGAVPVIRINDSLGQDATIGAFDAAMAKVLERPSRTRRLILDLTETPSGGNSVVARGILSWFVKRPTIYQVHRLPSEERRTGIARQWAEQVLPRPGKYFGGKVEVRVGRWTGSMGEGIAIAFDALGADVPGDRMAGLLGAVYDFQLPASGLTIKFPAERLYTARGLPREAFEPKPLARPHRAK